MKASAPLKSKVIQKVHNKRPLITRHMKSDPCQLLISVAILTSVGLHIFILSEDLACDIFTGTDSTKYVSTWVVAMKHLLNWDFSEQR
ncbi:hypothetical protein Y1Q_0002322 [Alligator mississippiensis]|uniref:Uncharacterized protein n=1 Tax=Alligator mississippiensis TaxID=8496 RepID=A0A151MGP5_ALLMI|nr:hypothetical protein Y1Q_0002322 [Alligator mississippiensis]